MKVFGIGWAKTRTTTLGQCRKHLGRIPVITEEQNERRRILYGLPFPNVTDEQLIGRFEQHNRDVDEYFSSRSDLLIVDWSKGDGWREICNFLGKPVPNVPFPRANAARDKPWTKRLQALFRGYGG